MRRLILVAPLLALALALAGCRDGSGSSEPSGSSGPGASVQHQVDDIESTLDSIESELNAG